MTLNGVSACDEQVVPKAARKFAPAISVLPYCAYVCGKWRQIFRPAPKTSEKKLGKNLHRLTLVVCLKYSRFLFILPLLKFRYT